MTSGIFLLSWLEPYMSCPFFIVTAQAILLFVVLTHPKCIHMLNRDNNNTYCTEQGYNNVCTALRAASTHTSS